MQAKEARKNMNKLTSKLLIDIPGQDQLRCKGATTRQPVTLVVISPMDIVLDIVFDAEYVKSSASLDDYSRKVERLWKQF